MMKKNIYIVLYSLGLSTLSVAQNVNIPDANFKTYLLGNLSINTNSDTEIQVSEAAAYNGTLLCNDLAISDLTGLEAFTNIQQLFIRNNNISSIDLSQNTALINLFAANNQLQTLDVSQNVLLNTLECHTNQITSITFGANANLFNIYCYLNQLTSIDLSNLSNLILLSIGNNPLTSLDVSANTNLYILGLLNNPLTSLDLSANVNLMQLTCSSVPITSMDLSNNPLLEHIYCFDTEISSLNIANGANDIIQFLWIHDNPNLTCVKVDDASYSAANWPNGIAANEDPFVYDNGLTFSEDCASLALSETVSNQLITVYPNPAADFVTVSLGQSDAIQIFCMNGTLVYQSENAIEHTVATQNLESGVYLIRTSSGGTSKLLVE